MVLDAELGLDPVDDGLAEGVDEGADDDDGDDSEDDPGQVVGDDVAGLVVAGRLGPGFELAGDREEAHQ